MNPAFLVGATPFAARARRQFPNWSVRVAAYIFHRELPSFPNPLSRPKQLKLGSSVKSVSALVLASLVPLFAGNDKSREFEFPLAKVWMAAVDVSRTDFVLESTAKERGMLSFRAGPTPRASFHFDVSIRAQSQSRTTVTIRIRGRNIDLPMLQKAAWRSGDKFLANVGIRLTRPGGR